MALKYEKYSESIIKLLKNKKNINYKNKNKLTPLMIGLKNKQFDNIIKLLINKKTNLNEKNNFGLTPLMIGLYSKYDYNIIQLLIYKDFDYKKENFIYNLNFLNFFFNYEFEESIFEIVLFFYKFKMEVFDLLNSSLNCKELKFILIKVDNFKERDIFGWSLSNYLFWKYKNKNLSYLLVFN